MKSLRLDFKLPQQQLYGSRKDFLQSIENTVQIDQLLEEFYFTSKYANYLESKYLQHIAGTLSLLCCNNDDDKRNNNSNDCVELYDNIIINILNRLKDTINYTDSIREEEEEEKNQPPDPSSPSSCSISTCSSSSSSSSYTTSAKLFSRKSSCCTAMTAPPDNSIPFSNTSTFSLQQQIDAIIDKLSRQLKQKDQVIRLFEIQNRNLETQEQLAKQRERSAHLVLELEKKKLLLNNRREQELRDQLTEEVLKNQLLQDQVSSLEYALKTKNKMIENSSLEIETLRSRLREKNKLDEKYQQQFMMQQLTLLVSCIDSNNRESGDDDGASIVQQLTKEFKQLQDEKKSWLSTKQSIINQCSTITTIKKGVSVEKAVEQLVSLLSQKEQQQEKQQTLLKKEYSDFQLFKEQHNDDNLLLKSKQAEIAQLQEAIKTFTMRESAYILQSASTEAELERILKEYDRLTRNIIDFNKERRKYQAEIKALHKEKIELQKKMSDQQICHIESDADSSALRKEFRDLMVSVKEKHQVDLLKELEARRQVEQELREKMSEIEIKRWEKVDVAVQTPFLAL